MEETQLMPGTLSTVVREREKLDFFSLSISFSLLNSEVDVGVVEM